MSPRMLDLFCGAGGAAMGYHRAGFDVVGVDQEVQPRYPMLEVHQGDALAVLADVDYCREFDAIHASPPCQGYSRAMGHLAGDGYPRLIGDVLAALERIGRPWVVENVPGAEDAMPGHVVVCGTGLGLRIQRHRLFSASFPLVGAYCDHRGAELNPHNQAGRDAIYAEYGRGDPEPHWRRAMGVEWMGRYEAREAIPPAFTEHIGWQLVEHLARKETAA